MPSSQSRKKLKTVDGVLLLDKPAGLTSQQALTQAKRIFKAKKAGHTGTLDPFATGLLPLCFGEATKFSRDLLNADKTYETVLHLGEVTATGDTEGEIISKTEVKEVSSKELETILSRFRGEIRQIPPMYSALKKDGKPLYEYARAGIELERDARLVTIHSLELLEFALPFVKLGVCCSKGTYIRTLGDDIGKALGCGAHLKSLKRIKVGELVIGDAYSLEELEKIPDDKIMHTVEPLDHLLSSFPAVYLPSGLVKRFTNGQRLSLGKEKIEMPRLNLDSKRVRVYAECTKKLMGTGIVQENQVLAPERLIAHSSCTY